MPLEAARSSVEHIATITFKPRPGVFSCHVQIKVVLFRIQIVAVVALKRKHVVFNRTVPAPVLAKHKRLALRAKHVSKMTHEMDVAKRTVFKLTFTYEASVGCFLAFLFRCYGLHPSSRLR